MKELLKVMMELKPAVRFNIVWLFVMLEGKLFKGKLLKGKLLKGSEVVVLRSVGKGQEVVSSKNLKTKIFAKSTSSAQIVRLIIFDMIDSVGHPTLGRLKRTE